MTYSIDIGLSKRVHPCTKMSKCYNWESSRAYLIMALNPKKPNSKLSQETLKYWRILASTRVSGKLDPRSDMARECLRGQMAQFMRAGGTRTRQMVLEDSFTLMALCTWASGKMTNVMDKASTITWTVPSTMANGYQMPSTASELRHGLMALSTKDSTKMEISKARANSRGPTVVNSKVISRKTR